MVYVRRQVHIRAYTYIHTYRRKVGEKTKKDETS